MGKKKRVGIILAGGTGSRLFPITRAINKQLIPVYDKPMIYYPLSTLMLAGIRDILIITNSNEQFQFKNLLGDGHKLGISISYETQEKPNGIAEAFIIAKDFIYNESVCLILGDNIFYGQDFVPLLKQSSKIKSGAIVFSYKVKDPQHYGVVEVDNLGNAISIEEKPKIPKSDRVVTGLYFYDDQVSRIAERIKPSARGELEITSVNEHYLSNKNLRVIPLGRGFAWLDTGTHENLLDASEFIGTIEKRQGYKIACIEEIAFNNGWISKKQVEDIAKIYESNDYGDYLLSIINFLQIH